MPGRTITALLLTVALLACGAADKDKTAAKDKTADKKDASKKDEKPACMHCGATCGLVPICVCESGTKKKPKVEFDVKCEPICVAGCGSKPRPFDLPPLNGTTSRERIWEWSKPREATNATRKEGTG
jgi:hypothetical protein